jgi:hypothetical protein
MISPFCRTLSAAHIFERLSIVAQVLNLIETSLVAHFQSLNPAAAVLQVRLVFFHFEIPSRPPDRGRAGDQDSENQDYVVKLAPWVFRRPD